MTQTAAHPTVSRAKVDEELRLLLHWQKPGEHKAGWRAPRDVTTAIGCPETNRLFRELAAVDDDWTDADTWQLLKARLKQLASEGRERAALRYLLRIATVPANKAKTRKDEKQWRQREAWKELGYAVPEQVRHDRNNETINQLATHLLGEIETLANEQRPRQGYGWPATIRQELVRRMELLPEHYPRHLSTSMLAPLLHAQPLREEAPPRQESEAPQLPPLPEDRSGSVDEMMRAPGARVVLYGDPGAGKTTMLRGAVLRHMSEHPQAVALFVPLMEFADQLPEYALQPEGLVTVLLNVAARIYGPLDDGSRAKLARAILERDDSLLCLDGFDEASDGAPRLRLETAIETLSKLPGACVFSTRPTPRVHAGPASGWEVVGMEAMRTEDIRTLVDLWFPDANDRQKERTLDVIGTGVFADIAGSPLLLGFIAYAASFDRGFDTIAGLYDQYIALTLERIWKAASGQEVDDVLIADLVRVATDLAWQMADGAAFAGDAVDPGYGQGWRDLATLNAILKVSKKRDRNAVYRLVRAEGLFTIADHAASRLHTSYRWVHRTVQEHLVGMRLLDGLRVDVPETFILEVEALLGRSDDWSIAMTHLYAVLPDDARIVLIEWLLEHRDDPRLVSGTADRLLGKLSDHAPTTPGVVRHFLERGRARGAWQARLLLEPEKARGELLQTVIDGVRIDEWRPLSGAAEQLDASYLKELIAALQIRPNLNAGMLVEACILLARCSPNDGAAAYIDSVEAGLVGLAEAWDDDIRAGIDGFAVAAHIAKVSSPEPRWRLAHFFTRALGFDPAPFIGAKGPLTSIEFDIAYVVQKEYGPHADVQGSVLSAMATGEYGDLLAYLAAKGLSADAIRATVRHPWAIVGAWEYVILNGGSPTNTALIRDEPVAPEQTLTEYQPEWRADAELMRRTYRAVADSFLFPDRVSLATIVEMYRRVVCDPDRVSMDFVTARVDTHELERVVHRALGLRSFEQVVEYILQTKPTDWASTGGRIYIIAEYAENLARSSGVDWTTAQYEEKWERLTDLFLRVVEWGAKAGLPMMPMFKIFTIEAPRVRDAILERLDWQVLRLPENLAWFDEAMSLFGRGIWKDRRQEFLAPIL